MFYFCSHFVLARIPVLVEEGRESGAHCANGLEMTEPVVNFPKKGGGQSTSGGGGSDVEARLSALEKSVERATAKVDTMAERLSRMEGELTRLPGYPGLIVVLGAFVALISGIVGVGTFLINNVP
jgi:hypothetical protein